MSEEKEGRPEAHREETSSGPPSKPEIEDELSPIDTMEYLSRAGRPRSAAEPAEAQSPPTEALAQEVVAGPSPVQQEPVVVPESPAETAAVEAVEQEVIEEAAEAEEVEQLEAENFDTLLVEYLGKIHDFSAGDIIDAEIVDVKRLYVLVDVGDKAEGVIDIEEFVDAQGEINISVGDTIPVQILERDDESGQISVSHRRALDILAWLRVQDAVERRIPISGRVSRVVRGGLIVDIGLPAFMPASQVDTSRVENLEQWVDREIAAYIVDLDRTRRRVVLSRRKLVREDEERKRQRILESLEVGQERVVRVKKIMDFGAFVDLGGVDGLIPREEVSWDRSAHPSEYLREGRDLKVRVVNVDRESGRVALSRKRVRPDPWEGVVEKYPVNTVIKGKVVGLADFGAFVSLQEGIQGLIHSSDLSWSTGRKQVKDFLKVGDTVKAAVLEVDGGRRRISLGLKQVTPDPWLAVETSFQPGTTVKGTVTALANYGAFVKLTEEMEGLIHLSEMTWDKKPKAPSNYLAVGQEVEAVVLKTDRERRRISLSLKQMSKSPVQRLAEQCRVGSTVRGKVTRLTEFGAFVEISPGVEGLIHISQLDDQRIEKPDEAVKVGEIVDVKVLKVDLQNQRIALSRKAYLKEQEAREVEAYVGQSPRCSVKMGELLRGLNIRVADDEERSR